MVKSRQGDEEEDGEPMIELHSPHYNDTATLAALDRMIQPTSNPRDLKSTAFALRLARLDGPETEAEITARALASRRSWLTWLTVSQRKWQRKTRRPSRARHHDSVAIREKYVRCAR